MRKVESFSGTGRPRILSLEIGINEYLSANFFDEAINWSGVVNVHCMQVVLVTSTRFIFGDY